MSSNRLRTRCRNCGSTKKRTQEAAGVSSAASWRAGTHVEVKAKPCFCIGRVHVQVGSIRRPGIRRGVNTCAFRSRQSLTQRQRIRFQRVRMCVRGTMPSMGKVVSLSQHQATRNMQIREAERKAHEALLLASAAFKELHRLKSE